MLLTERNNSKAELEELHDMGVDYMWQCKKIHILCYALMAIFGNSGLFTVATVVLKIMIQVHWLQ